MLRFAKIKLNSVIKLLMLSKINLVDGNGHYKCKNNGNMHAQLNIHYPLLQAQYETNYTT